MNSLVHYPTTSFTRKEEVILLRRYHAGDTEARDKLLWTLTTYVRRIACYVVQFNRNHNNDLTNDIIHGLLAEILERFSRLDKQRFTTVLGFFKSTLLFEALRIKFATTCGLGGVTEYIFVGISKIRKMQSLFEKRHKRLPTTEELADLLGYSCEKVGALAGAFESRSVELHPNMATHTENETTPLSRHSLRLMREIAALSNDERSILEFTFGINSCEQVTTVEAARRLNIPRTTLQHRTKMIVDKLRTILCN